jgi:hypothetical protein
MSFQKLQNTNIYTQNRKMLFRKLVANPIAAVINEWNSFITFKSLHLFSKVKQESINLESVFQD